MQDFESRFRHPLAAPVNRVLTAIESFDGSDGRRSLQTAWEVRLALQHLLSVAETDGGSAAPEIISLLTRDVVCATGWSTPTLAAIHRDLQLILCEEGPVI